MQIPFVTGSSFDSGTAHDDALSLIIDSGLATELFGGSTAAIGKTVNVLRAPARIVGVVAPVRRLGIRLPPPPMAYLKLNQWPLPVLAVVARPQPSDPSAPERFRSFLKAIAVEIEVVQTTTMNERIAAELSTPIALLTAVLALATAALVVCVSGAYGAARFHTHLRCHDVAVMVALGASARTAIMSTGRPVAIVIGAAAAVGLVISLWAAITLRSLIDDVTVADPIVFVLGTLTVVGVAFAATYWPLSSAARSSPLEVLREP
jgi:hypothetical protein